MQFSPSYFPLSNKFKLTSDIFFSIRGISFSIADKTSLSSSISNNSSSSKFEFIFDVNSSRGSTICFNLLISSIISEDISLLFQKPSYIVFSSNCFICFIFSQQSK